MEEINTILELDNPIIYDILSDRDSVLDMIMKKVLEQHPFAITAPNGSNNRWQTSYKGSDGIRKNLKAPTKEVLLKKLIKLYSTDMNLDKFTFYELYLEWLEYKQQLVGSPNTILRHKQHYKKYFESSVLHTKKIKQIDLLLLESECNRIVKDNNLSRKEWVNIKTILLGMFEYAHRKHYIKENPMPNVKIQVKYRQVPKKTGATQTYNEEELKQLLSYLESKYTETMDTVFLAVKLNFLLGLRVGELVALKWTDIENNKLHIVREEVRNQVENTISIAEHTKTHQDRFVILVPKALEILNRIETTDTEYIFMRDGNRITSREVAYVLEKYAERNGLKTKSTHKMRKTYASNLSASGVPIDAIREQLGHSDLATTLGYIYNPYSEQATYDLICKAL